MRCPHRRGFDSSADPFHNLGNDVPVRGIPDKSNTAGKFHRRTPCPKKTDAHRAHIGDTHGSAGATMAVDGDTSRGAIPNRYGRTL